MKVLNWSLMLMVGLIGLTACSQSSGDRSATNKSATPSKNSLSFDPNQGSLAVPHGFEVVVVADNLGNARHLSVSQSGDIYINLGAENKGGGLVALRDSTGDGVADQIEYFGSGRGTASIIYQDYLYYSTNTEVFRYKLSAGELIPSASPELMLTLPAQSQHAAKALAFDNKGQMYVSIGAPANACQDPSRTPGVPGQDPCPLLETSGGVWQFSASQPGQTLPDGSRYATGIRHIVGMDWNQNLDELFAMQHGRDQLHQLWPQLYTESQSAELPAEEMLEIQAGDNFGWPYCYFDQQQSQKMLAPEYGGDGTIIGRCSQYEKPIIAFPGHWAPNSLKFISGSNFPAAFQNGAFVAFHGSWNRAPFPQAGYKVVYVPFNNGKPTGKHEDFATKFAGDGTTVSSPGEAEYRPCGLAFGPDGSLYICDSSKGRVWRVVYTGK